MIEYFLLGIISMLVLRKYNNPEPIRSYIFGVVFWPVVLFMVFLYSFKDGKVKDFLDKEI